MRETPVLDAVSWVKRMQQQKSGRPVCSAFYSSVVDGIVTDPAMMVVPVDDHLVHRGDGVFESLKCIDGVVYNLNAHLDRLEHSRRGINLECPWTREEIMELMAATLRESGRPCSLVRLLLSRGGGTMGVDPYACDRPELYIAVYDLPVSWLREDRGTASAGLSRIPIKTAFFATIKSCNYLPNVLMKKEAVDRGLDYVISLDEHGKLGESATENFAIVTPDRRLISPPPERVLAGTTLQRVIALAQELVDRGLLQFAGYAQVAPGDVEQASEMFMIGTTRDVLPVTQWEGRPIGDGCSGTVYRELLRLLREDMAKNPQSQWRVFT